MKISRKELYDLVWSETMTSISKRFGLSIEGLRKHCKSMSIPTPPNGYWSKLKYGKNPKIIPLPKEYTANGQSINLGDKEQSEEKVITLSAPLSRYKIRELEICGGDITCFEVPEVLYAKDPILIDTKEKFQRNSENTYLKKSPYKSKIGPTLDVYTSEKLQDRALTIFSTVIKALRFRGHNIKIANEKTYAVIYAEEIQINITERKKQDPNSENPRSNYYRIFSGELHFNIFDDYNRIRDAYKDTIHTKIEDKIVSIVAYLEIRSEKIKEERIEAEQRRIIREKEEHERKEFEEKKKSELKEFKSLFAMAERLHKTNILQQYIGAYEEFVNQSGEMDEEIAGKIQWAKEKADWLDPFISKEDKYMDYYDPDEIIQPACPRKNTWDYTSYTSSSGYSFWSNPFRKWS